MDTSTNCQKCGKTTEVYCSRWCEACYYPGIDQDYEEYQAMLDEGHRPAVAAVQSGWKGIEEI